MGFTVLVEVKTLLPAIEIGFERSKWPRMSESGFCETDNIENKTILTTDGVSTVWDVVPKVWGENEYYL